MSCIVVGVEGSAPALDALRFATPGTRSGRALIRPDWQRLVCSADTPDGFHIVAQYFKQAPATSHRGSGITDHHRYVGLPDCSHRGTSRRPSAAVERPYDPVTVRPDRPKRTRYLTHRTDRHPIPIVEPGAEHMPATRVVRPPKLNVAGQAAGAHRSVLRSVWSITAAGCRSNAGRHRGSSRLRRAVAMRRQDRASLPLGALEQPAG